MIKVLFKTNFKPFQDFYIFLISIPFIIKTTEKSKYLFKIIINSFLRLIKRTICDLFDSSNKEEENRRQGRMRVLPDVEDNSEENEE